LPCARDLLGGSSKGAFRVSRSRADLEPLG
jgi:hypothetical protein